MIQPSISPSCNTATWTPLHQAVKKIGTGESLDDDDDGRCTNITSSTIMRKLLAMPASTCGLVRMCTEEKNKESSMSISRSRMRRTAAMRWAADDRAPPPPHVCKRPVRRGPTPNGLCFVAARSPRAANAAAARLCRWMRQVPWPGAAPPATEHRGRDPPPPRSWELGPATAAPCGPGPPPRRAACCNADASAHGSASASGWMSKSQEDEDKGQFGLFHLYVLGFWSILIYLFESI